MFHEPGGGMRLYLRKGQESEVHWKVGGVFFLCLLPQCLPPSLLSAQQPGWLQAWCKEKGRLDTQES